MTVDQILTKLLWSYTFKIQAADVGVDELFEGYD